LRGGALRDKPRRTTLEHVQAELKKKKTGLHKGKNQ